MAKKKFIKAEKAPKAFERLNKKSEAPPKKRSQKDVRDKLYGAQPEMNEMANE